MNIFSCEAVLSRLKAAYGVKSDVELAKRLGKTPQTVSTWKARDSVPYSICVQMAGEEGLSLDWLLTGKGPMRHDPQGGAPPLDRKDQMVLELFNALGEEDQREILHAAQEKKRLHQMMSELEALLAAHKNTG